MKPITVLIVDDSLLIRKLLCDLIAEIPDIKVAGTAANAEQAREEIKRLNPDVLTLDVEMPGMDGISFLEKIMSLRPMPVIMISTLTAKGAVVTLRALEAGAVDFICKPVGGQGRETLRHLRDELADKIRMAARANPASARKSKGPAGKVLRAPAMDGSAISIIAIGSSTGGVEALRDIFSTLPENCPPIVVTQHMPAAFTAAFAARLNGLSRVTITEAIHGKPLECGHAYIAPGGHHLKIRKKNTGLFCELEDSPPVSGHCPSVDVLFDSVADTAGANAIGIVLTGMGKDGAAGMLRMRKAGAHTIGQNEASCVVYGMPHAAKILGAVEVELPLADIAGHIISHCGQQRMHHYAS